MKKFITVAIIFLCAFAGSVTSGASSAYQPLSPCASGQGGRRTPIVAAIEKARPAVVSISAVVAADRGLQFQRDPFRDEFFDRFFERRSRPSVSFGSGVIIDGSKGLVVTNEHVVKGAEKITITLADGREMAAEILGADARFDLAVLSVKTSKKLPELELGNSNDLMIGETVIAIGSPFQLSHSATTGVVSATGRSITTRSGSKQSLSDLIQTDASINPGNSGGPLVNINGEIIGINTAILAGGEGLGFAIPAEKIKRITARLIRGESGNQALDLGLDLAESGLPRRGETGLLILKAAAEGPAGKGGLKKGDMLMSLDGAPMTTMDDYEVVLSSLAPGHTVKTEIVRNSQNLTFNLTPKAISEAEALDMAWHLYGLKGNQLQDNLVLDEPLANSPAAILGLRKGDVLLRIGTNDLKSPSDLAKAIL